MNREVSVNGTRYPIVANMFFETGKMLFDINFSDNTKQNWIVLMRAIRAADILIDTTDNLETRLQLEQKALQYLASDNANIFDSGYPGLDSEITNLKAMLDRQFSLEQKNRIIDKISQICRVTEQLRHANTPKALNRLTALEGQLVSRLLLMTCDNEARDSENYQLYYRWGTRLGRISNVVDTFFDLPTDHQTGLTKVAPSNLNRIRLLACSFPDLTDFIKSIPATNLTGLGRTLVRMGIQAFRYLPESRDQDLFFRSQLT